jgi:hypothetical protein
LVFVSFISCNSERTRCLKDKNLHTPYYNGEPSCDLAFFALSVKPKVGQENEINQVKDIFILNCLVDQIEKEQCNKKSDIIPATW